MAIGVEFKLTNGEMGWYDPVDEDEFDGAETETAYHIDIGSYKYTVQKADVASVRKYQLCENCGFEKGTCDCKEPTL